MKRILFALMALTAPVLLAGQSAKVPRPAGEFVIKTTPVSSILLSQYRGKVVVLEVLLTTCPHCQRASSVINKLYAEYGPKGMQPLGAAINDGAENLVPGFIANLGLKYPVGVANRDMTYEFLQASPVAGPIYMPTLVFIDKKGTIRGQYFGDNPFFANEEQNIRNMVEMLLKEPAGGTSQAKPAAAAAGSTSSSAKKK